MWVGWGEIEHFFFTPIFVLITASRGLKPKPLTAAEEERFGIYNENRYILAFFVVNKFVRL